MNPGNEIPDSVDFTWKVVLMGAGGVGKTTFLQRYITNEFVENTLMTIGVSHTSQYVRRNGHVANLVIWDLGGQDRFKPLHFAYTKGTHLTLLCVDLSDWGTFEEVDEWIDMMRKANGDDHPIILVGTKADLLEPGIEGKLLDAFNRLCQEKKLISSIFTSSKLGFNVKETIDYVVDYLVWWTWEHSKNA
jgi:small GTP-binding protein